MERPVFASTDLRIYKPQLDCIPAIRSDRMDIQWPEALAASTE